MGPPLTQAEYNLSLQVQIFIVSFGDLVCSSKDSMMLRIFFSSFDFLDRVKKNEGSVVEEQPKDCYESLL